MMKKNSFHIFSPFKASKDSKWPAMVDNSKKWALHTGKAVFDELNATHDCTAKL